MQYRLPWQLLSVSPRQTYACLVDTLVDHSNILFVIGVCYCLPRLHLLIQFRRQLVAFPMPWNDTILLPLGYLRRRGYIILLYHGLLTQPLMFDQPAIPQRMQLVPSPSKRTCMVLPALSSARATCIGWRASPTK
jgi:hypothetical protein